MAPKAASGKAKKAATHPKYSAMIKEAITSLGERTGSSRQAIFKFIDGKYKVGEAGKTHLRMALKRGVDKKELVNPKGHGGSYRLAPKAKAEKKPKKATKKKSSAKKPKKAASAKKPAAKKTSAKKTSKKSAAPKKAAAPKAKKPTAKKTSKKAKAVKATKA